MRPAGRSVERAALASMLVALASCATPAETDGVVAVDSSAEATVDATVDAAPPTAAPPTTASTAPPGTVPPRSTLGSAPTPVDEGSGSPDPAAVARSLVASLAADELGGRDNGTAGSAAARDAILAELARFAVPPPGLDGYVQPFDAGVNVLGLIPGTDLADEYVVLGAHYDHLGDLGCDGRRVDDSICNGAADNASGVAAALAAAATVAAAEPRRSVLVALWDAEEDGLLGSIHYVSEPVVPLDATVAYVNLDILGSNLLPSLDRWTLSIGAETGGTMLTEAVTAAAGDLRVADLGLVFGQGRSDHAPFAASGVPAVFLTDLTNGCYHTVDDELAALDLDKLDAQIGLVAGLVTTLVTSDARPTFVADTPPVTYGDAESILAVAGAGRGDLDLLGPDRIAIERILDELTGIVADGPAAFDEADAGAVLAAAAELVDALDDGWCPTRP